MTRNFHDVIIDQREYFGRTSAVESAELLFEIDGRVKEIIVSNGDVVMIGDHLTSLDTTNLEVQLLDAEEELAVAQSLLTSAENQLLFAHREVDLQVQLAQISLDSAQSEATAGPSTQAGLLVSQREIKFRWRNYKAKNLRKELTHL